MIGHPPAQVVRKYSVRYGQVELRNNIMTNEERWVVFIKELREYIDEHHLCPPKHTTLRNQVVYFRRKMRDGLLGPERARELEEVLSMRDLSIHTGGRRPKICDNKDSLI